MDRQPTQYLRSPRYKWKALRNCSEFRNLSVQFMWIRIPRQRDGQSHGQTFRTQWFLSNETCTDTLLRDYYEESSKTLIGTGTGKSLFVYRRQGSFRSVYVDDIKLEGKNQNRASVWKNLMKDVDLDELTSFLDHVYLGCIERECKPNEDIVEQYRNMFESRILPEQLKITRMGQTARKTRSIWSTTWRDTPRNVWRDIVNW